MRNERTRQPRQDSSFISLAVIRRAVVIVLLFISSAGLAQSTKANQPTPMPLDLSKYPGLLPEFGQLFQKLQRDVQVPPARSHSRLLPLLPESTIFYAAFPNYGDASHQALQIFQDEVRQNSVLRQWWQQGEMAENGPKIEDGVNKFYLFSQYLGEEIVVSATHQSGKDPCFLILAEVRKPGLKDFLRQAIQELSGKSEPALRVLDEKELGNAIETRPERQLTVLVRPDFVAAALDVATLRSFNARLGNNTREFAATPFGQRVAQAYEGGVTMVGAANLESIISQLPIAGNEQNEKLFERTGFAQAKYLVWEHRNVTGRSASQVELSFSKPRHGVASWLAPPGQLGGLDFVSPKAAMAGAVLLKNPAEIFDDVKSLATVSNPDAFAALAPMEQGLKISLRDDLLGQLGGEIAYEAEGIKTPNAVWKIILRVHDAERLQTTLDALRTGMHVSASSTEAGGITYHTLRVPSGQTTTEINYAFADGYMVIASSRETIADAIRVHRSGQSLAKSEKFLAALPPGRKAEASALFYQLPGAMAAMSVQQAIPGMTDLFSQAAADPTPAVACVYGEETTLRESSRSGGVDAGVALIAAAVAIPNLLRSRMAANDSSAVAAIRTANTAQVIYHSAYPERGYAADLASLGPDPGGSNSPSPDHASVIDATLGNASCAGGAWCTKSGFRFIIKASCLQGRCAEYVVVGTPVDFNSGTRSFCSTSDGVVRFKSGPPLTMPVHVAECRRWAPLQ